MTAREGPSGDATPAPRRPSLIGAAAPSAAPSLSVLAALDGTAPKPVGRSGPGAAPWLLGLGGLAVAAVLAGWMLRQPAAAPAAIAKATPVPAAMVPASAVAARAANAAPSAPAAAVALARLEDLPAAASAPASPLAALAATAPAAAAVAAKPAERSRTAAPREKARAKEKDKDTRVAKAKPEGKARPAATAAAAATATAVAAAPAAASAAGDADVNLIAALVQHMNRADGVNGAGGANGRELTIADLVARCKSQPAAESQRCIRRICENYWGRAEACPRSAAPSEVAVRP